MSLNIGLFPSRCLISVSSIGLYWVWRNINHRWNFSIFGLTFMSRIFVRNGYCPTTLSHSFLDSFSTLQCLACLLSQKKNSVIYLFIYFLCVNFLNRHIFNALPCLSLRNTVRLPSPYQSWVVWAREWKRVCCFTASLLGCLALQTNPRGQGPGSPYREQPH